MRNLPDGSLDMSAISILSSNGFGKGTLSRNLPDHQERQAHQANPDAPFETPSRFPVTSSSSSASVLDRSESSSSLHTVERYQLSFEEAFYLASEQKVASFYKHGSQLSLDSLWTTLGGDQGSFYIRYFSTASIQVPITHLLL